MATNGNGNGKRGATWLQLTMACIGTAIAVFTLQNSLLESRVTVTDETQFRETVNRRLAFLEASDLRALTIVEKHRDEDSAIFKNLEGRLREAEIDNARILARILALENRRKIGASNPAPLDLRERIRLLDPLYKTDKVAKQNE